MSNFAKFMKANKIKKENVKYAVTKSLVDENGEALEWTFKPLTTKESNEIRESATYEVQVKGKPNMYRPKVNTSKYITGLICTSVVEPNLHDKELQDSYGVMCAEDLLVEMVDDVGEFSKLTEFIQEFNGITKSMDEKVEEAKN